MVSEVIKRFILTSIDSVPHWEAILLLRHNPQEEWNAKKLAQTLFINDKKAEEILADLYSGKFISQRNGLYVYDPVSAELKEKIDALAGAYSTDLIEITNLIHSKTDKQAQQFGDAFKWQNGKE